jgi:hypothetical protein
VDKLEALFKGAEVYDKGKEKKRGREKTYDYPSEVMQTRLTVGCLRYIKIESAKRLVSQSVLFTQILEAFMREKPYLDKDFTFLKPRTRSTKSKDMPASEDDRWIMVNIITQYETARLIRKEKMACGVSIASFLLSGIHWWIGQNR